MGTPTMPFVLSQAMTLFLPQAALDFLCGNPIVRAAAIAAGLSFSDPTQNYTQSDINSAAITGCSRRARRLTVNAELSYQMEVESEAVATALGSAIAASSAGFGDALASHLSRNHAITVQVTALQTANVAPGSTMAPMAGPAHRVAMVMWTVLCIAAGVMLA